MDVALEEVHVALAIRVILRWAGAAHAEGAVSPAAWLTSPSLFPAKA